MGSLVEPANLLVGASPLYESGDRGDSVLLVFPKQRGPATISVISKRRGGSDRAKVSGAAPLEKSNKHRLPAPFA